MKPFILRLHLEPQPEGGFTVTSPDLEELVTEGETVEECVRRGQEVAQLLYETCIEFGDPLPAIFGAQDQKSQAVDLSVVVGLS